MKSKFRLTPIDHKGQLKKHITVYILRIKVLIKKYYFIKPQRIYRGECCYKCPNCKPHFNWCSYLST